MSRGGNALFMGLSTPWQGKRSTELGACLGVCAGSEDTVGFGVPGGEWSSRGMIQETPRERALRAL